MWNPLRKPTVWLLTACVSLCALPSTGDAAIRVVEDEVYFTLRAPGARAVYLVGDFNNWNATVEKMQKTGDIFEISLYMVEGSYRYKFVVDGQWIVDPDNPGDPTRGSPMVLVAKPAGLMLMTEGPAEEKAAPSLSPWFRYIGQLRWNQPEDRRASDFHIADLGVRVRREKLRGNAVLKSTNESWAWADPTVGVSMDRGRVGTDVGGVSMDAFKNDNAVWTSLDPATLVGKLGVFEYNAGYDRSGVSVDYRLSEKIHFRGFYADHTGPLPTEQPAISTSDVLSATSGADTTAYTFERVIGDSDVLGLEFYIDASGYQCGIVTRHNHGLRPGTMADISIADSTAVVYGTREDQDAAVYWFRLKGLYGVGVVAGYGRGRSEIHQLTREVRRLKPSDSLEATQLSEPIDGTVEFETSNRFIAGLDRTSEGVAFGLDWDRSRFEFGGPAYGGSEATVDRITFDFGWRPPAWSLGCRLQYTRQDYGDTPPTLLIDSPARNMWLDWRDMFTVPNIVGIDTEGYTDLTVTAAWYPPRSEAGGGDGKGADDGVLRLYPALADPAWSPPSVRFELGTTTNEFFEALEYNRARLTVTYPFKRYFYAVADGRVASYDKASWGPKETFLSGYIEAGCRYRWLDVNLGWGFDPVIFDRVTNDFNDIGRLELLRLSIADGVTRGESAEIGERLLSLENLLRNVQTIKLEVVVRF